MRIVSLIASATEIVAALGRERDLVARSHECDFPPLVLRLPAVTAPKFNVDGASYQIDQRVKAIVQEGLSVYRIDAAALERLRPDVIITQAHCEVCAVSLRDVEEAVCTFVGSRPRIVSLEPNALGDVWTDIRRVAAALEVPEAGERLVASLRERMGRIAAQASGLPRPRVACVEWIDPLMAAGNWMPELVEQAGGENLFGQAGKHSPGVTFEDLAAADPELIFVSPCGYDLDKTRAEMGPLAGRTGWADLAAVATGRVYLADGNQYFNRPGPRLVESLEILAEVIHPGRFRFGHEGAGWERFGGRR